MRQYFSIVAFFLLTVLVYDVLAIILSAIVIVIFIDRLINLKLLLNAAIMYYVKIDYLFR